MKLNLNFLKLSLPFGVLSILLVSFSLYLMLFGKSFNLGTDFTGGVEITVTFDDVVTTDDLNDLFQKSDMSVEVQSVLGEKPRFFLRSNDGADDVKNKSADRDLIKTKIETILNEAYGEERYSTDQYKSIGGTVSTENRDKAVRIIFFVCCGIIAYTSLRFKYQFGIATLVAVIHDVIIMLGPLVYLEKEINVFTITATLTIFGYSVNDTIVLLDRIREGINEKKILDFRELVNHAINGVFSRTLITSLTTLTVVSSLYFFSQGAINDFSFALLVGLIVGTYSSIYVATSVILLWHKYKPLI